VVDGTQDAVVDRAREAGIPVTVVPADQLERALTTQTPQPLVAVARTGTTTAADVLAGARSDDRPLVVLAGVSDPGNAGTVIRSAAGAGAAGVLLTAGSVDPTNPKCIRASAGTYFALPVAVLADLTDLGLRTVGATVGGAAPDDVDLSGPVALVFGSEAHGLPGEVAVDERVTVPLEPGVESLNVAMAATVLLYEARRQRLGGRW
jgi:TrmH family RNA methyltransferase